MNLNFESENKGNILIVDDILENLQLISDALLKLGYTVRRDTSERMALKTVKVKQPDAILLDVKMPEMDGYQVCITLKADQNLRSIPLYCHSILVKGAEFFVELPIEKKAGSGVLNKDEKQINLIKLSDL